MGLGIIGIEFFQTQTQVTLVQNESVEFSGYTLTYRDLKIDTSRADRESAKSIIEVIGANGKPFELKPARDFYYNSQQSNTTPGLRSTPIDDLYVILVDWLPVSSQGATFKIYRNPLVFWLWAGTMVLILGTLLALWPKRKSKTLSNQERQA